MLPTWEKWVKRHLESANFRNFVIGSATWLFNSNITMIDTKNLSVDPPQKCTISGLKFTWFTHLFFCGYPTWKWKTGECLSSSGISLETTRLTHREKWRFRAHKIVHFQCGSKGSSRTGIGHHYWHLTKWQKISRFKFASERCETPSICTLQTTFDPLLPGGYYPLLIGWVKFMGPKNWVL